MIYRLRNDQSYTMSVASVSAHEYSMIKSILLCDTLTDRIDRVPFNSIPFYPIWLKDLLG